jgi:hypothetical protein
VGRTWNRGLLFQSEDCGQIIQRVIVIVASGKVLNNFTNSSLGFFNTLVK